MNEIETGKNDKFVSKETQIYLVWSFPRSRENSRLKHRSPSCAWMTKKSAFPYGLIILVLRPSQTDLSEEVC